MVVVCSRLRAEYDALLLPKLAPFEHIARSIHAVRQ